VRRWEDGRQYRSLYGEGGLRPIGAIGAYAPVGRWKTKGRGREVEKQSRWEDQIGFN